jgi:undecaprenyl-diphosphatase
MIAATGYDLLKSALGKGVNPIGVSQIGAHGWGVLIVGLVISFLVAYAAVAWFIAWVRKHGFMPFAIYRIIAGTAVLVFASHLLG